MLFSQLIIIFALSPNNYPIMEESETKKRDIYKAYERAIKEFGQYAKYTPREVLIRKAMTYPAPQFYVSYEQARRIISAMFNGKKPKITERKKAMYDEIYKKFMERTDGKGFSCLKEVLKSEASSFFISRFRFEKIVREAAKGGLR